MLQRTLLALMLIAYPSLVNGQGGSPAPVRLTPEQAKLKVHPRLRQALSFTYPENETGSPDEGRLVMVTAVPGTDLSPYLADLIPTRVLLEGQQDFYGKATPAGILKMAGRADVLAIHPVCLDRDGPEPLTPEELAAKPQPVGNDGRPRTPGEPWWPGWPATTAEAEPAPANEPLPPDFFDVKAQGPHKSETAWARGYRGENVTVAILDDGIDWGHPDLMGRQKIYSSANTGATEFCGPLGCAAAYNGWPMAYSPYSLMLYVSDATNGTQYLKNGQTCHYADTSATPALSTSTGGVRTFSYTPWKSYGVPGATHTYTINATMTKSGTIHAGTHPCESIRDFVYAYSDSNKQKVAVLVTDPNESGKYDTVYVDLNNNFDFRDDRPLTRANPANPSTWNNMIAYADVTGDGKADLSGGALYFIADGQTPIPHAWVRYNASQAPAPANGCLVAFSGPWNSGYSHGTQCASQVAGQGKIDALVPAFSDLPGGRPSAAVFGAAPKASVVDISNVYWDFSNSILSGYLFTMYGYDGQPTTLTNGSVNTADTDAIQITSNSYGSSSVDNDGWDYPSRYASQLQRKYGRNVSMCFSTGNGAPGYGTEAPPSPDSAVAVGASTVFGSTGWDSIFYSTQIQYNDVIPFSNRGPGARGVCGVDVLADGAYAAGDEALNYYCKTFSAIPNGNYCYASWGGTSRSCPAAAGNLALLYQAFRAKNNRWPWWDEARALYKSTATDLNYDPFTQGSGSVNADRATAVAAGLYGLYVTPDEWNPGNYRGNNYPGFVRLLKPGQKATQTFTVRNTGPALIRTALSAVRLEKTGSRTISYTITPEMFQAKSPENFYKAPDFIIPITAKASKISANPWWNNVQIPAGTELMIIRLRYPYNQFDPDDNYAADNRFRLIVYNWRDASNNGKVWTDKNGNGVVNYVTSGEITQIDGGKELDWQHSDTELDQGEYERFTYAKSTSNNLHALVHNPLTRMIDGLFIGISSTSASTVQLTDLTIEIEFYKHTAVPWLSLNLASLNVLAGQNKTFIATADAAGLAPGLYQAAIKVSDPGATFTRPVSAAVDEETDLMADETYPSHITVIPVSLVVAPDFSEGMTFGGQTVANNQANDLYNNGLLRGGADWAWREECGDWRFFFFDNPATPPDGSRLLVKTTWTGAAPHNDVDTVIMGPASDAFTSGTNAEPNYFGPYTLVPKGASITSKAGRAIWRFTSTSGAGEDWVAAPVTSGLHLIAQHHVLSEGDNFGVVTSQTAGTIRPDPPAIHIWTFNSSGTKNLTIQSGIALPGLSAGAFGLGTPQTFNWNIPFVNPGNVEFFYDFTVAHACKIQIDLTSNDISDADLVLYYFSGGQWRTVASSSLSGSNEQILYINPPDGNYKLGVNNYSGPAGTAQAVVNIIQGNDLTITGASATPVPAGTPVSLQLSYNKAMQPFTDYTGQINSGPPQASAVLEIPVTIHFGRYAHEYIPVTAHTGGANNTFWRSDLDFLNLGANDANVELALFKAGLSNTNPDVTSVKVPAGRAIRLIDVLETAFEFSNAAIGLRFLDHPVLVNSRFYNTAPTCNNGTFGMFVPPHGADRELTGGGPSLGVFHFLGYTPGGKTGYRTNIGMVSMCNIKCFVRVRLFGDNGQQVALWNAPVEPFQQFIFSNLHAAFNSPAITHGYATVEVLTAGARVQVFAMLIDNVSGDPVFIPMNIVPRAWVARSPAEEGDPGLAAPVDTDYANGEGETSMLFLNETPAPADGYDLCIPAAAHNSGAGTVWRSDVDLLNTGNAAAAIDISLLRQGLDNSNPTTVRISVPAGRTTRLDDILGSTFNTGNAALGFERVTGNVMVNSRFYNTGSTCSGGTFGMYVPALPAEAALPGDGRSIGVFHHISYGTVGGTSFRTNVGFASNSAFAVEVLISLYGDAGELLGEKSYTLKPFEHIQFSAIHRELNTPAVSAGFIIVTVKTAGGEVHTYAMLIDNKTNDPIFVPVVVTTRD